jgi:hypothetical protein
MRSPTLSPKAFRKPRVLMIGHSFGCGVRSITFFERINFILPSSLPSTESIGAIRVIPFTFSPTRVRSIGWRRHFLQPGRTLAARLMHRPDPASAAEGGFISASVSIGGLPTMR